jgi:hypothetical protein
MRKSFYEELSEFLLPSDCVFEIFAVIRRNKDTCRIEFRSTNFNDKQKSDLGHLLEKNGIFSLITIHKIRDDDQLVEVLIFTTKEDLGFFSNRNKD